MKAFVFWTGIMNFSFGLGFMFPAMAQYLGEVAPTLVWSQLLGVILMFLGVILVLCSRDIERYATIICWEGVVRIAGFLVMGGHGFLGDAGVSIGFAGVLDLLIGGGYLIGLSRSLNLSPRQLLFPGL